MQRVVVARKSWREVVLPPEVRLSHKRLVSRRTGAHGPRLFGNASGAMSRWEQDDQETTRASIMVLVVAGQADFQIGNYVLHCPEGTFIFIPPGVPHPVGRRSHLEGENRECGSCDLLWFGPQGRRVQCWLCYSRGHEHSISNGLESVFPLNDRLIHFVEFMQEEAVAREAGYEELFEGSLRLFLKAILRELKTGRFLQVGASSHADQPVVSETYDPIVRAQEYIAANLAGSLTIDKVAGMVHMSRAQFTRRFVAETGQTFNDFVITSRLEQAKVFLRETDSSVEQIANFIGFRSASYFHSLFRRRFVVSPVEYRRQNQVRETPAR